MKKSKWMFGLLICICCSNPMRQDKLSTGVSKKENNRGFKIVDSLDKYLKSDSLFCYPGQKFYIGVANNLNFGLVMLNDSSFILYQKLKTKWVITDTIDFPLTYVFKLQDLNGDSFKDVIITYSISSSGGNGQDICLIYDPKKNKLIHNKNFDLPNIRYDKSLNLVLSPWWGGATHCQSKESYRIEKDSLIFNSGVMLCPNENVDQEQPGVQFYKMINGKRIIIKSIKGTPEKLEKIFNQSIWNSNDE